MNILFKDRIPFVRLTKGSLSVSSGALEFNGKQVPVGQISCLFLGPGTSVTHSSMKLLSENDCHVVFSGRKERRIYSVCQSAFQDQDKIATQVELSQRLETARWLCGKRFPSSDFSQCGSLNSMRGKEGHLVKNVYSDLAQEYDVDWDRRETGGSWNNLDSINKSISIANSWLYGVTESAVLMMGLMPGMGIIHKNRPRGFVYDIADVFKSRTSMKAAFEYESTDKSHTLEEVFRDRIQKVNLRERIFPLLKDLLSL